LSGAVAKARCGDQIRFAANMFLIGTQRLRCRGPLRQFPPLDGGLGADRVVAPGVAIVDKLHLLEARAAPAATRSRCQRLPSRAVCATQDCRDLLVGQVHEKAATVLRPAETRVRSTAAALPRQILIMDLVSPAGPLRIPDAGLRLISGVASASILEQPQHSRAPAVSIAGDCAGWILLLC